MLRFTVRFDRSAQCRILETELSEDAGAMKKLVISLGIT